jgi:hypothetical protein
MPPCFSIVAMLLYVCSLNNLEDMENAVEIVKPAIQDGIEFYTSADGKLNGVSQIGCARLCGVSETTMRRIINDLGVRQITPSNRLEHLVGKDCCLALTSPQQAKVLDSKVVASLISYYAIEKRSEVALHSMDKFMSIGIDTWIQKITGYSEPNETLGLLNSINSTMGKLLVKVERLEEIETETIGYRKATVTLPVLQKWMEELSENEKQKLLEPAEELLTIKEAMASLHPGCVFSQTLHKKLALKVGQTITALSDKPNVKKLTPNGKGFNMAVNGYTKAQLPLIKLCLQSIMG